MFNNVAFDVVTGLVLVYLLYSLMVTLLGEYISNKLGLRARILRVALERMLNDGYYEKIADKNRTFGPFFRWLRRNFLYEDKAFDSTFAGKFYANPSIKFLSRVEKQYGNFFSLTKPSYISADYFSDALINLLKDKGVGETDAEKIRYNLIANTYEIQQETLKYITELFDSNDLEIFREKLKGWYNETMDRATGWYKRKLQLVLVVLGFFIAAAFNLDSIRLAKILSKDKDARRQMVELSLAASKDSTALKNLINKNDTLNLNSNINTLSKDISDANILLGMGWQLSGKSKRDSDFVDSESDSLRFKSIDIAYNEFNRQRKNINEILKRRILNMDTISSQKDSLQMLELETKILSGDKTGKLDSLKKVTDSVSANFKNMQIKLLKDSINISKSTRLARQLEATFLKETFIYADSVRCSDKDKKNNKRFTIYGTRKLDLSENTSLLIKNIFTNFFGLFITALALSLGAPFWFDILNKVVSIRGVGIKPEEKKTAETPAKPAATNGTSNSGNKTSHSPTSSKAILALEQFKQLIKNEPGLVSVGLNADANSIDVLLNKGLVTTWSDKYGPSHKLVNDEFAIMISYKEA